MHANDPYRDSCTFIRITTAEFNQRHRNAFGFLPLRDEQYDFVVPKSRANRAGVAAFKKLLNEPSTRKALSRLGMKV
jgi:molybdate-binding protein